jgi:hypothetical protein
MTFRLGTMSIGDVLDRSLKILLARLFTFYGVYLIVFAPVIGFIAAALAVMDLDITKIVLLALAGYLVVIIAGFIVVGAQIKIIEQMYVDRRIGPFAAVASALPHSLYLMVAGFLLGIVVFVGCALCCVPGCIILCMFAFTNQCIVLEGLGPIAAMDRSSYLSRDFRLRIFGIFALILVAEIGVSMIIDQAILAFLPLGGAANPNPFNPAPLNPNANPFQGFQLNWVNLSVYFAVRMLVEILFYTYLTICLTLAYFDLRTRKEGFDLLLAAEGLPQRERDDFDDDDRRDERDDDYHDDDDDRRRRRVDDDRYDDDDRDRRRW